MSDVKPFLSATNLENNCLLCKCGIKNEKSQCLTDKGWEKFKDNAKKWKDICIPSSDSVYNFIHIHDEVSNSNRAFGKVHKNCRATFSTKIEIYLKRYGINEENIEKTTTTEDYHRVEDSKNTTRKSKRNSIDIKRKCFICNETRIIDNNCYNEGGLARCEMEAAEKRLSERSVVYSEKRDTRFHEAANRFNLLCNGQSFDSFAIDIYYHKSCYIKYALNPLLSTEKEKIELQNKLIKEEVLNDLYRKLRINIIIKKEAYLLHHLHQHFKLLCEEYDLEDPISEHSITLKRLIMKQFPDEIDFFPISKYVIVHSSGMNPCEYSVNILQGKGLRDTDYVRTFANFIRKKVNETDIKGLPDTPDGMINEFEKGPVPELYNVIYASMYSSSFKINDKGYAITNSENISTKIWSIASDWQTMITRKETPKHAMLGLTIHRLTGSKEVVMNLNKFGHSISYNKVREYNDKWSKVHSLAHERFKGFAYIHSSIDNNDGKQETLTGSGTTHDTNMTLFNPLTKAESATNTPIIITLPNNLIVEDECENTIEIPEYAIGPRKEPPPFNSYNDDDKQTLLTKRMKKDTIWSIANGLPLEQDSTLPLLGSWTAFNRKVSSKEQAKSLIEYLPIINQPPKYDVCKHYLDSLNRIIDDLGAKNVFVHADEEVYSRLVHIIWKHGDIYKKAIVIMGGFHQLRVKQKLIYKQHGCLGFKEWFVDAGIIAPGSVEKAFTGYHYYRCMRLLKESFDALIQIRVEQITDFYGNMDKNLLQYLKDLRRDPSAVNLEKIVSSESFQMLYEEIVKSKGLQDRMTLSYLFDVSSLLALLASVREGDVELHCEGERRMLKQIFAFDHQNYARYLTYQHVMLNNLKSINDAAYQELNVKGFGANYSGSNFAAVHGDLVTEYFNRETKGTAGPFRQGYSTDTNAMNKWVKTIHIHAKLRMAMRDKVKINTSTTHKELTDSAKRRHQNNVSALKQTMKTYNTNPFDEGPAKIVTTGVELDSNLVNGLLNAPNLGNKLFLNFVNDRLIEKKESFYEPIKRQNIDTGFKKKKKSPRAISVLKEDVQAFGLLVEKAISLKEAFCYPITTFPLSLANPDGTLRQGNKANFRNQIIKDCPSSKSEISPKNARWIYDGMAIFRSFKPRKTYREWFQHLGRSLMSSARENNAIEINIVNDQYFKYSIKNNTRTKRSLSGDSIRVHIRSLDQKMIYGKEWESFFENGENKEELIKLACSFFKSDEGKRLFTIPLTINEGETVWKISDKKVTSLSKCNHEEADTRMVMYAAMHNNPAVIVAKDTDVFILLLYATTLQKKPPSWYMKIDSNNYVNITMIHDNIGSEICEFLPQVHCMTGCDTTSYKFNVGKIRVYKKILKDPSSLYLIKELGQNRKLSVEIINNAKLFVQTVLYSGDLNEDYVEFRIRFYEKLKKKSSVSLPPDPDSLLQEIKRVHIQCFIWLKCCQEIIPTVNIEEHGWIIKDNEVMPLWFIGNQLPPSLTNKKETKKIAANKNKKSCSDNEEMLDFTLSPAKKKLKYLPDAYEADEGIVNTTEPESDSEWESDFSSESDDSSDSDYTA